MTTPPAGLIFTPEQQYALDHLNGDWGTNNGTDGVVYLDALRDRILAQPQWTDELRRSTVASYLAFRIDKDGRMYDRGGDIEYGISPDTRVGAQRRERRPEYVAFCEAMLAAVTAAADEDETAADEDETDEQTDLMAKAIEIGGREWIGRDGQHLVYLDIVDALNLTHDHMGKPLSGAAERTLRGMKIYVDEDGLHLPDRPRHTIPHILWPRIVPQLLGRLGLEPDEA